MKGYHWLTILLVLLVVYLAGVKFPGIGQKTLSTVGL